MANTVTVTAGDTVDINFSNTALATKQDKTDNTINDPTKTVVGALNNSRNQIISLSGTVDTINTNITGILGQIQSLKDNKENLLNEGNYIEILGETDLPRTIGVKKDDLRTQINTVDTYTNLTTDIKTIVGSINELKSKIPDFDERDFIEGASLVNLKINEDSGYGDGFLNTAFSTLHTANKTTIGAINELKGINDTQNTNITNLQNQLNNLTIVQSPFITHHQISILILGVATSIQKCKLSFKKGNNIYNMGSINNTLIDSQNMTVSQFGTTWRAYLSSASTNTTGTNITATYTNGTKTLQSVDCISMSFPNTNTLILTFRDNTTTPATISFDISSLT